MTDVFVVSELGTVFPDPFEKMMLDYLFTKWSISDPAKGSTQKDAAVNLRFKTGFPDFHKSYEVNTLEIRTDPVGDMELGQKHYSLLTYVDVNLRMKRLPRDLAVNPQMKAMKDEVLRIAGNYKTTVQDIVGIKNILWRGDEGVYTGPANFATSNWGWVVHLAFWYEMDARTI